MVRMLFGKVIDTSGQILAQWSWAPFPTITEKGLIGVMGRLRKWAKRGCKMLWELPESIKIEMVWPLIEA